MPDLGKAIKSFRFAGKGIRLLCYYENNARIHLIIAALTIVAAWLLSFSMLEWCVLTIQIFLVLAAEAFNTAIEKLCDFVSADYHPLIGRIKDLAAGGVLLTAISAVITGALLFLPKILQLL